MIQLNPFFVARGREVTVKKVDLLAQSTNTITDSCMEFRRSIPSTRLHRKTPTNPKLLSETLLQMSVKSNRSSRYQDIISFMYDDNDDDDKRKKR